MRRTFIVLLTMGVVLFRPGGGPALSDPSGTIVWLSPSPIHVTLGSGNFTVDVRAENVVTRNPCTPYTTTEACGLGAYDFEIHFDQTKVQWVSTVNGPFLTSTERLLIYDPCTPATGHDPANGVITYQCLTSGNPPGGITPFGPDGSGVLATVTFAPLAEGTTTLALTSALTDVDGAPITHCPQNGSVTVGPVQGVWAAKTGDCRVAAPANSTYTVTAGNLGPGTATSVQAVDTLPSEAGFVSASSGCNFDSGTHTVTCDLGSINSGATKTANITVSVPASAAGKTLLNAVDVSSGSADPVTSDNHAELSTVVQSSSVDITKTAPSQVDKGSSGQYQITVDSNGPSAAADVVVTDQLPTGVAYVSHSTSLGSCSYSSPTLTCNLGEMAASTSADITINVTFPNQDVSVCNHAALTWTATPPGSKQSPQACTNVGVPDSDGDGCSDVKEQSVGFNILNRYDFYDVPVPAAADPTPSGSKNKLVDIGDPVAVLFYAFAQIGGGPNGNGVDYQSLKDGDWNGPTAMRPDGTLNDLDWVGRRYDRSTGLPDPDGDGPFRDPAGQPDGFIDISDALGALAQFGLDCNMP